MTEKEYKFLGVLEDIASELTLIRKVLQAEKKAPTIVTYERDGTITWKPALDLESYFELQEDDGK